MMLPTLHMNGTSPKDLFANAQMNLDNLRGALDTMTETGPNARDYYPQGDQAFQAARAEHEARMTAVRGVINEFNALLEHIADDPYSQGRL
jgi:hypothetical protein